MHVAHFTKRISAVSVSHYILHAIMEHFIFDITYLSLTMIRETIYVWKNSKQICSVPALGLGPAVQGRLRMTIIV